MKTLLLLSLLSLLASAGCAAAFPGYGGTISSQHDRFEGTRSIRLEGAIYSHPRGGTMTMSATGYGDASVVITFVPRLSRFSLFARVGDFHGWEYLDCHGVSILADGQPVGHGQADHDGSVGDYGVTEIISVELSSAQFQQLASATHSAEFRICNDEFTSSPEQRNAMLQLFNRAHIAGGSL